MSSSPLVNVSPKIVRVALCQLKVGACKQLNLKRAQTAVRNAAHQGATLIALPECFNCPYSTSCFSAYAECVPEVSQHIDSVHSPSVSVLSELAKECGVHLIGGSMPERDDKGLLYNSCVVLSPSGTIIAKHRKIHLFDIDVVGAPGIPPISFHESDVLTCGNNVTTFDLSDTCRVGVGICYDVRFPEYSQALSSLGCSLMIFPAAFNMTTGPAHWQILQQARAIDNQCFFAMVSPARNSSNEDDTVDESDEQTYVAYGHSMIVSPWGDIVADTDHHVDTVFGDLDLSYVDNIRDSIPVLQQKRPDVYKLHVPTNKKQE